MAIPISGKIYTFACIGAPSRVLNLYYPNSIANGQNVCLWTADNSLEQQWKYSDNKLLNMRNTTYALDKYTAPGNANDNNADIWTANNPTNQNIVFQAVSGNTIKIKLSSSDLYLTAVSNANGTSNGKTPSSTGNVYWAPDSGSSLQQWTFKEIGGIPASGVGNGTLTVGQRPSTLNYNGGCYTKFSAGQCTWHAYGRAFEVTGKTLLFSATSGLHAKQIALNQLFQYPIPLQYGMMVENMAMLDMWKKFQIRLSILPKQTGILQMMRSMPKTEK